MDKKKLINIYKQIRPLFSIIEVGIEYSYKHIDDGYWVYRYKGERLDIPTTDNCPVATAMSHFWDDDIKEKLQKELTRRL